MVAQSIFRSLVPRWQKAGMVDLVSRWQKVWMGTLCHGGRKGEWRLCVTVAESKI